MSYESIFGRGVAIFASIAISSLALAEDHEKTLCEKSEEIYFSCQIEKKILSICASGNISPKNGYVQYRYGAPGHIELEYPSQPVPPKGKITISDISEGNVSFTHLKFKHQGYAYVVYQGFPTGLYIKKGKRTIFNKICQPGVYQQLEQRAFRGIDTIPAEEGIDR
jgi:hypothetical protein